MTALIQSSSGVTVITVGLVSAGLLTLRQAIGIVMGANIGTTVTSFLIGFKLGNYALPMLFIGAVCLFLQKIGQSIISDASSLVSVVSFCPQSHERRNGSTQGFTGL